MARRSKAHAPDDVGQAPAALEAAVRDLQSRLAEAQDRDRRRTEFFANASHELRAPLTLVLGVVRRLRAAVLPSRDAQDQLDLLERHAHELVRLVDGLIEGAVLESGAAALAPQDVDLAEVVREVVAPFEDVAREHGIVLDVAASEPVPAQVDPDRVRSAVTNLLANAFSFTPDGGQVRVAVEHNSLEAVVEVADSGPGVPPEERERVFERFQQLRTDRARKHGGAGLGLAIVRDVAVLHHGSVSVGDAAEGGAAFRLVLPLVAHQPAEVQQPEEQLPSYRAWGNPLTTRPLVLVIEDQSDLNRFLVDALEGDYDVIAAYDGATGLRVAGERLPTVIVTDVLMPGLSGEALVRELRANPSLSETPVLVLTAKADDDTKVRLLQSGANDYVVKPFDVDELRARVDNLVRTRMVEQQRRLAQDRVEGLLLAAPDATVVVDGEGRIVLLNNQAETAFGYEPDELLGQLVEVLLPEEARAAHPQLRAAFTASPRARTMGSGLELSVRHKDGTLLPVDVSLSPVNTPEGVMIIAAIRDVSLQRQAQERLRFLALHDALTGLPNRVLLAEQLSAKLGELNRREGWVAVFYIDLDRFKHVNDQYGHAVGDEVLAEVGRRLMTCVRPQDVVGRLGGDEFAVACGSLEDEREALVLAERVAEALEPPLLLGGEQLLPVSASVGVAVARSAGTSAADLLRFADTAMYRAKQRGRNRIEIFDDALGRIAQERVAAERLLRTALDEGGLRLLYQPMVGLADRSLQGVEALVRVDDGDGGLVAPEVFLEVAEESGLVLPMGRWVLGEACRQAARWQQLGHRFRVWVNLSGRQLVGDLPRLVFDVLDETGADPALLGFELTETSFMQANPDVLEALTELTAAGIRLSLDDFGTGWSSLTYLKDLPVDTIKVDGSFTRGLGRVPADTAIVTSVVSLGRVLDRVVVIEGMETLAQLALARALECDLAQGYLFAPPLTADEVISWQAPAAVLASVPPPRLGTRKPMLVREHRHGPG